MGIGVLRAVLGAREREFGFVTSANFQSGREYEEATFYFFQIFGADLFFLFFFFLSFLNLFYWCEGWTVTRATPEVVRS